MPADMPADQGDDEAGGASRFHTAYGASPFHLIGILAALALTAYTLSVVGISALWDPDVWWQSILVWFLGAIIAHDLVMFPLYALADQVTQRGLSAATRSRTSSMSRVGRVAPLNFLRIPVIAVVLLFLLFFPGILQQGTETYQAATGQTQEPFLQRWLLVSASIFALSAAAYAIRLLVAARSAASSSHAPVEPDHRSSG